MSKTFIYLLVTICVFLFVVKPFSGSDGDKKEEKTEKEKNAEKADTQSGTGLNENPDENGVSQGAAGQQKYRIGYTR